MRCDRPFLLLSTLLASACATDRLDLAPPRPDRPLVLPADFSNLPAPGSVPSLAAEEPVAPPVAVDPVARYDLPALIDLAQRSNPDTRVAWEKARQAALAVGLTETAYLPQISAQVIGGVQHTPLPIPSSLIAKGYFTSDSRELIPALTAKWLLFDFGQREGAIDEAKANSFVANVAFTGAHEKLIYQVSRDYFALGAARGRLKVAQTALETALLVQDAAEKRRSNGLATVVAVHQAERETAQARFNRERARGAERAAYTALMVSLGLPPSTQIRTADSSELPLPPMPSGDIEQLIREALDSRPDIFAALGKITAAEASLRGAKASYYPTIGVDTTVYENAGQLSSQGGPYSSVNLPGSSVLRKISMPLDDGGARDARLAMARSELDAARSEFDRTRDTASKQVIDSFDAISTSFAEYQAAVTLDDAAQAAYDSALEAYRHGVGTYTDLVTAETSLARAQSDREDAHANVFTAAAALAFATGNLQR
jgi:outer membrane protein TolC